MKQRIKWLFIPVITVLICLSCSNGKPKETYKIAAILPISGSNAAQGLGMINSCKVAVDELNANLKDYSLELVELDDAATPATAVKSAEKAAQDEKVIAVTAHWNSGCALATNPVFHRYGLGNLVPAAINSKITLEQAGDEIFRIVPYDIIIIRYAAVFATNIKKWPKMFIIDDNTFYGKSLAQEMKNEFIRNGRQVLGQVSIQVGDKDFSPVLTKIKDQKPDVIFYGGVVTEAALIKRQMAAIGLNADLISLTGIYTDSFIEAAGKESEGTYCVTVCPPTELLPGGVKFIRAYKKENFNHPYESWGILGYASIQVLAEAIKRVYPNVTRRAVIDELKKGEFETAIGKISFDSHGQTKLITIYVDQITNGKWKPIFKADGKGGLMPI